MDAFIPASMSLGTIGLMMPKLPDVRNASSSEAKADVRMGQLATAIVVIGIGGMVSYMTKDKTPIIIAVAIVVLLSLVYEMALRMEP